METNTRAISNRKLSELERQLERSGYFTHSSLSNYAERINEIESFLYGLIDTLLEQKSIDKNLFEGAVKSVQSETLKRKEHFHAGIAVRVNGKDQGGKKSQQVNCHERLHICKSACCRLQFALSIEEIEAGNSKWDLGQPYLIRQNSEGCCSHLDGETKRCEIYNDRPGVCRSYSCKEDNRIWKNFENMELNSEWIEENLGERQIELQEMYMIPESVVEYHSRTLPDSK